VTAKKMKGRDSLRKIKAASLSSFKWGCRVLKVTRYNKEQNLIQNGKEHFVICKQISD